MKNVIVITYWSVSDALIQTYTLPYVKLIRKHVPAGSSIYLVTLEKQETVLRLPARDKVAKELAQEGITWMPYRYFPFGMKAITHWIGVVSILILKIFFRRINYIHCWCTPAGAVGYLLKLITRKKLILDSYEPHAEAMVENGTWNKKGAAFRLLFWLEKKQTERADFAIAATEGMWDYAKQKFSVKIDNFEVKPACVDFSLFTTVSTKSEVLLKQLDLVDKIVCVYAGKFGGIYLEGEVFDFIKVASEHWGNRFRFLILTNHTRAEILSFCRRAAVDEAIVKTCFVAHKEVADYLGLADFALTPVKPVPSKRYCTPIKDGEYWAMGLPVVITPHISVDSEIILEHKIGAVIEEFSTAGYKKAVTEIEMIMQTPGIRKQVRLVAEKYRSFALADQVYKKVYG